MNAPNNSRRALGSAPEPQPATLAACKATLPAGSTVAPAAEPVSPFAGSAATNHLSARNNGWGNQPICDVCNRGAVTGCICGPWAGDDELVPAVDVLRIMDGSSWLRAEAAALRKDARNG